MKPVLTIILALPVMAGIGVIDSMIESYVPWLDNFVLTCSAALTIIVFITTLLEK